MSEQHAQNAGPGAVTATHAPQLRSRLTRVALFAAAAAALAAILGYLYFKTQSGDYKRQNEVLAQFRELKEIDTRWDVEVLRARTEFAASQLPAPDYGAMLNRIRQELAAATRDVDSLALKLGLNDLINAFVQKAEMVDKFKKANAATKQALTQVLAADNEIAGLVRGTWQEFRDRERLVAAENIVTQVIAEAQKYYFAPGEAQKKTVETVASDLREAAARLPASLREGLLRLDGNVQQLLGAKPIEQELYQKLSFVTAGPRVDGLTSAYSRELESTLAEKEIYRVYLVAFSGALLVFIGYLTSRLIASYRLINAANEELERRVIERTRELSEALTQLKESEVQLIQTEKMSSLGQMVAGVAHEINTPLAYAKNSLGSVKSKLPELTQLIFEAEQLLALLRTGAGDPQKLAQQFALTEKLIAQSREHQALEELQDLVKDGLYGIEQITEIVTNLKDFSRLDRSKVSSFNLSEGLDSALLLAKHELKALAVKKSYGAIPPITCSPSQLNQVFLNLINNAAQAIEAVEGVITLTTRQPDAEHVAVDIEDNGKGIPPEVLPKIFDPFFTTKDVGKGTGLGLSIVYKIVEQHGGTISVDSTVGVGTKFTVVLPLTPPELAQSHKVEPASDNLASKFRDRVQSLKGWLRPVIR